MLYQPGERAPYEATKNRFSWQSLFDEWLKPCLLMVILVAIINLFFPRYEVLGHSMEPGLHERDRLIVSNLDAMTNDLRRGEMVVLSSPVDGTVVVKRIIGLPGETVNVDSGIVYINNEPLGETYISEAPRYRGSWTLGADEYFVLGDNRNHSYDSADYGPVPSELIHGVVKLRMWPLNALESFNVPEYHTQQ
jgi:signal peptidase I